MVPARTEATTTGPASTWALEVHEGARSRVRDFLYLTKARLSLMVVLSAVVGYWLGAALIAPGALFAFALGTLAIVGGANAVNQVLERDLDARMARTSNRPIPAGRLTPGAALGTASLLTGAGFLVLFLSSGWMAGSLGLAAFFIYVFVYTPMKTRTPWATLAGAVSGALPTLMGWSATDGSLAPLALCLFGIVFFWQFPHTWAIAATYREDYERVGYRALPRRGLALGTGAATLALVATSLAPWGLGLAGAVYGVGALVLGVAFLAAAMRFGDGSARSRASGLLAASLFYLPLILALVAFDGKAV